MGRPKDPLTEYKVRARIVGGYVYAAVRRYVMDESTGQIRRTTVQLGRVSQNNRFEPNNTYYLLSPEERNRLIFPEDWDMSEARRLPSERGPGRPSYDGECVDLLYGDSWLMTKVAEQLDVTKDLLAVFDDNEEKVRDILTLAIFLYVTAAPFSHVAEVQDVRWFPSVHKLTPSAITRLLKSITEDDRVRFTSLRRKRVGKSNVCAVDSTTRSCRGRSLPDAAVGQSKNGGLELQTKEVVVYSLSNHEPIYYKTFPGNVPDSKTLPTILKDLHRAGYRDLIIVTDRGYESQRDIEYCILHHQKLVTATSTGRKQVLNIIRGMGDFGSRPPDMERFREEHVYCRQCELDMVLQGRGGKLVKADRLRLNLYLDTVQRAREQSAIDDDKEEQREKLEKLKLSGMPVPDEDCRLYPYYRIKRTEEGHIESFEEDVRAVETAYETAGFFAITTLGVDYTAQETLTIYGLRDEQEKYFYDMKTRIGCDLQRNWSEKARRGARFVEFVSLILISRIKHVWRSSETLRKEFSYVRAILYAMQQIHRYDQSGRDRIITIFLEKHMLVCAEFGIKVPRGCESKSASLEIKPKKKRGRPKKAHASDA